MIRDEEYLTDEDRTSLEIKKEELLIKYCKRYYDDNYMNLFCEVEARNNSYKLLLEYIKENVPSKIDDIKEIIKLELRLFGNVKDDSSYSRLINHQFKPFDIVFDEFVKSNFTEIFFLPLADDDVKNYLIHTYDCLGNRLSIRQMKLLGNDLVISEKTSKYELLKYLIDLRNIKDSYYKDKLNDFFTQYIRMYYSFLINNLTLFNNKYNEEKVNDLNEKTEDYKAYKYIKKRK